MNFDKENTFPATYRAQLAEDEVSLVDIYLTIKRNNKLFFAIILLSFVISLLITYFQYQSNNQKEMVSGSPSFITEYVLWIDIGKIYGVSGDSNWIDDPNNTLEKIKSIYIPKVATEFMMSEGSKLNQKSISVVNPKNTRLMVIKVIKTSDNINYNKVLMSLANYIIEDHNSGLNLNNKHSIKPTKIIQQPTKIIVKNKNKNKILTPILGIILGVFLGFFAIFMREFMKKVKEAENSIKTG